MNRRKTCMDHLRALALFALLVLTVSFVSACSCRKTDVPDESGVTETEPVSSEEPSETESVPEEIKSIKDVTLYWNVDRDLYAHQSDAYLSSRPKDPDDGMYHFLFATTENRQVNRRTVEPTMKNQIDEYRIVLLEFDEKNLIIGVKNVEELVGEFIANMFYVESVEEGVMTCYSSPNYEGEKAVVDLEGVKIFDCSDRAITVGESAKEDVLNEGSRVIVVPDFDGSPAYVFVYSRPKEPMKLQEHHTCPECGKDVEWWGWNDEKHLPTTEGHYFLLNDVKVTAQAAIEENQHVVLCLNGFKVTGTGKRSISIHFPGAAFTLCDCKDTGCISNAYTKGHNETTQGAVVWGRYGTFKMYSGKLDASKVLTENVGAAVCMNANTTFEFRGGEIIGGAATYGSAVRINDKANFVMTGGKMSGGVASKREEDDVLDIIGKNGTVSITGGTIDGGCYVTARPEITIGGEVTITGKKNGLFLEDDTKVRLQGLSGKSKIGILLGNGAGVFTSNYQAGAEGLFVSDDSTLKVASAGGAALQLVEINPHAHCICGTGTVTDDGHQHAAAVFQPWGKTDSLPKESGYYYLKSNVKLKSGYGVPNGATIYLCLNGFNIEQSAVSPNPATGNVVNPRIITFGTNTSATKIVVTNCGKKDGSHGKLYRSNTNGYNGQGAMIWTGKAEGGNTVELYNVNLDGRNYNTSQGTGGGAICVQTGGTLKAYNVTLSGGSATDGPGGAISMTGGRVEFYHSTISGGKATKSGGTIHLSGGTLKLSDTAVSGGTAPIGSNVYLSGGKLEIEGDTTVKEVHVSAGKMLTLGTLGSSAKIGIRMDDVTDPFAKNVTADLSKHFTSSESGRTVLYEAEEQALYLSGSTASDHRHCICGDGTLSADGHTHENVEWIAWKNGNALPTGTEGKTKYYYLTSDVKISQQIAPVANSTVYLCLNGHSVTGDHNGRFFALSQQNVKFVVTNCKSGGILKSTHTERLYDNEGGFFWIRYATDTVELYNVTLDAGTHKLAKNGGLVYSNGGTFKAYNTTFKGGVTTGVQNNGTAVNADGGVLNLKGTNVLDNCVITGGDSAGNGGAVALKGGTLLLKDTRADGGTAKGLGNGVYMEDGELTVSGAVILKDLYLASGKTIKVKALSDGASIPVVMADGKGTFAVDAFTDVSSNFTSVNAAFVVRYAGKDKEVILASPSDPLPEAGEDDTTAHEHCVCGTGSVTAGSHAHEAVAWEPWESTTSLPNGAGEQNGKYYYLVTDVTVNSQITVPAGSAVSLCLNGHKVTATNNGRVIALSGENSKYVLTNCKEKNDDSGIILKTHTARTYDNQGGILWMRYASDVVELYNVTLDNGTHKVAKTGGVAAVEGGTLTAYHTTLRNGTSTGVQNSGTAVTTHGGVMYLKGNAYLYGSKIQNGQTAGNGGGIAFAGGTLYIEDTEVSGNTAAKNGNDVNVAAEGVTLSGLVKIDELEIASGKEIAVGNLSDGSSVKVRLADKTGVFASGVDSDVLAYFTALDEDTEVRYDAAAKTLSVVGMSVPEPSSEESSSEAESSSETESSSESESSSETESSSESESASETESSSEESSSEEPPVTTAHVHCICGNSAASTVTPSAKPANGHEHDVTVEWVEWSENTLPKGPDSEGHNHFYLTKDVSPLGAEGKAAQAGNEIYLCLNGFSIKNSAAGRRILNLNIAGDASNACKYVITNCGSTENGHGTISSAFNTATATGGMFQIVQNANHTIELYNVVVEGSSVKAKVGAVGNITGNFRAYDVTFNAGTAASTTAGNGGGAFYVTGANSTLALYGCTVSGGRAKGTNLDGGNLNVKGGTLILDHTTVKDGECDRQGGNVYATTVKVVLRDSVLENGTAGTNDGGNLAVYNENTAKDPAELTRVTMTGGTAARNGGNASFKGTMVAVLTDCTVTGGTASGLGNTIYYNGTGALTLSGETKAEVLVQDGKLLTLTGLKDTSEVGIAIDSESGLGVFAGDAEQDLTKCFRPNDGLFVLYDKTDKTLSITDQHVHCACAQTEDHDHTPVTWLPWNADASADYKTVLPQSGDGEKVYYYLTEDVNIAASYSPGTGETCICLNGHTIRQTLRTGRLGNINNASGNPRRLTITDCKGTGVLTIDKLTLNDNGGMFMVGGQTTTWLNLYHLKVDGSKRTVNPTSGAKGNGSILYMNKGNFKAVDVEFLCGTAKGTDGAAGVSMTGGTAEFMNCTFTGGSVTAGRAGTFFVSNGSLTLKDTTITGATSTTALGSVFVSGGSVSIEGKSVIDSLYLASGKQVAFKDLSHGASISVKLADTEGVVAENLTSDVTPYVKSGAGLTVIYKEDEKKLLIGSGN